MPGEKFLTPYQKAAIKRYYEHKGTRELQKLGEIVTNLYLCESEKKAERLWGKAKKLLLSAGANKVWVEKQVEERNLEGMAEIVNSL